MNVLGIGTPIIDYLYNTSNTYVDKLSGQRGGSVLVDHPTLEKILHDQKDSPEQIIAGGGSANTIKGLAKLGHPCVFCGKIGRDEAGKKFSENLKSYGIASKLSFGTLPTAQVACLITPDHERTMRAFLGAGMEMSGADLSPDLFKDVRHVHIEGYLMNRQDLVEKAMKLAKEAGATISFDLSSFEIVEEYKQQMHQCISNYVDIVFARDKEAKMLTGLPPDAACDYLKNLVAIAVIKMGAGGSMAATKKETIYQQAYPVKVVDTTGAGDLFASGFLHGFLSQQSLKECLHFGALVASYVIQVPGAEIPDPFWEEILQSDPCKK
jgi:sugar/nucleoside kinase (ribokinase family)